MVGSLSAGIPGMACLPAVSSVARLRRCAHVGLSSSQEEQSYKIQGGEVLKTMKSPLQSLFVLFLLFVMNDDDPTVTLFLVLAHLSTNLSNDLLIVS